MTIAARLAGCPTIEESQMSIVSDFLNLLGVHVERPRFGDIEQIDAETYVTGLFN